MKNLLAAICLAFLSLFVVQVPVEGTEYKINLVNQTGLKPSKFSLYAVGYSVAGKLMLDGSGRFVPIVGDSGQIAGRQIGGSSGQLSSITLDTATPVDGGIVLIAVVPAGRPAPYVTYTEGGAKVTQPTNPPSNQWPNGQGQYLYQFIELTQPAGTAPTIDVSLVDGFVLPITATVNPSARRPNGILQVGQPLRSKGITRTTIFQAYRRFIGSEKISKSLKQSYLKLLTASGKTSGRPTAVLNPGLYLAAGANPGSPLNTVWNATLQTLFQTSGRLVGMIGDDGAFYQGTPTDVDGKWVLDFQGYTDGACTQPNGRHYRVYSPLTPDPAGSYQTNESAGCMVFANDGVFADSSANAILSGPASVGLGLQRDIVAAINRGVALSGGTDGLNGSNSQAWGLERNWYSAARTYNVFARFMHTGRIGNKNIFVLPPKAVKDAQGAKMGQSYGFGYDESPVHSAAGQPNVPSKFDPVPAATTQVTITLGPWS